MFNNGTIIHIIMEKIEEERKIDNKTAENVIDKQMVD